MIATKIDIVQSGFELCHKGSLPFLHGPPLLPIDFSGLPSILHSSTENLSVLVDFRRDAFNCFVKNRLFQLALPDNDDIPPLGFQLSPHLLVAHLITVNFRHPILRVRFWNMTGSTPLVSMPKTPMHKYDCMIFW